jgi:hypothetical protein
MKDLGKKLGIDVYVDRSRCQYACAKVHIWNIDKDQYGNNEKSFSRMEEVETRFKCFWHLMSETIWMIWSIMNTMICTYPDISYALNFMSIYQSDKCHKMITGQ